MPPDIFWINLVCWPCNYRYNHHKLTSTNHHKPYFFASELKKTSFDAAEAGFYIFPVMDNFGLMAKATVMHGIFRVGSSVRVGTRFWKTDLLEPQKLIFTWYFKKNIFFKMSFSLKLDHCHAIQCIYYWGLQLLSQVFRDYVALVGLVTHGWLKKRCDI